MSCPAESGAVFDRNLRLFPRSSDGAAPAEEPGGAPDMLQGKETQTFEDKKQLKFEAEMATESK